MRGRPHSALLAAAMLQAMASPRFHGAVEKLPIPVIPEIALGGSNAKPGKHRSSGTGSKRFGKGGNNAGRGTAHCGAKQAAKYAKQGAGINVHFNARMRWNETVYPRVLELQAKQRERSGR